jgi:hypothetical protein
MHPLDSSIVTRPLRTKPGAISLRTTVTAGSSERANGDNSCVWPWDRTRRRGLATRLVNFFAVALFCVVAHAEEPLIGKIGQALTVERGEWTPAKQAHLDATLADIGARQAEITALAQRPAVAPTGPAMSEQRAEKLRRQTSFGAEAFPPMDQWVELVQQNQRIENDIRRSAKATDRWNVLGLQIANADATPRAMGAIHDLQFAYDRVGNRTALHVGALAGGLWIQRVVTILVANIPVSENLPGAPTVGALHAGGTVASPFLLIGTGLPFGRGMGTGLYRSTNSGANWTRTLMDGFHPGAFFEMKAAVADPQRIYACTNVGMFASADGGINWRRKTTRACSDFVEFGGTAGGALMIAYVDGAPPNLQYALPQLNNEAPWDFVAVDAAGITGSVGRISLAIGNPASQYMYAYVADTNNNGNGIFRSSNFGLSGWQRIAGDTSTQTGTPAQRLNFGTVMGAYANVIGVSPVNDNVVAGGMVNLFVSTNATATTPTFAQVVSNTFDHTAIDFVPQSVSPSNTRFVFANDGGVYTYDWVTQVVGKNENVRGMNVQVVMGTNNAMSQSHANRDLIGAGLWDIGSVLINRSSATMSERVKYLTGADGGAIQLSTDNAQHMVGSFGSPWYRFRSTNQGASWTQIDEVCNTTDAPMDDAWALTLEPTPGYGRRVYTYVRTGTAPNFAARLLRQNLDDPNCSWTGLHPGNLPVSVANRNGITSLQVANDPNADRIYVADTRDPDYRAYRYTGTSPTMAVTDITPNLGGTPSFDTWLTADRNPGRPRTVYVVTRLTTNLLRLMLSDNAGDTWENVTGDINNYAFGAAPTELIANPANLNQLFVATAIGVFRSNNRGVNWKPYNAGLPTSIFVVNLEFDPTISPPRLLLGSYGRGFYFREVAPLDDVIFEGDFEPLPPPLS